MVYNEDSKNIKIFDFRSYHKDLEEPYYILPNKEFGLSVYIPSYFDEVTNQEDVWEFTLGGFKEARSEGENIFLVFEDDKKIVLTPTELFFPSRLDVPIRIKESKTLENLKKKDVYEIKPRENWVVGSGGITFRGFTPPASHFLATKRGMLTLVLVLVFILFSVFLIGAWYYKNSEIYLVSQGEVDTLTRLSFLPEGRVLVYDRECLWCSYETEYRPAVFANKRTYVRKLGKHPTVPNLKVFTAATQEEAKKEFEKLGVDYIYIVKYEDYIEKTPFSPGDLGIEKIYSNANSELWRRKK